MKNAAIVILAILTVMFGMYGFMQSIEAQRQRELVVAAENEALESAQLIVKLVQNNTTIERELLECRKKQWEK